MSSVAVVVGLPVERSVMAVWTLAPGKFIPGDAKLKSDDIKMIEHGRAHKEHVRLRNLKVAGVAVDREEVNSRVECSCRSHWGLSETFQMSAVEKGVATGWRALKMRVFICSWMKPKSSRQGRCCCYYCFISLSLGGISGESPRIGWESAFSRLRIHRIIRVPRASERCPLRPNVQLAEIAWKQ